VDAESRRRDESTGGWSARWARVPMAGPVAGCAGGVACAEFGTPGAWAWVLGGLLVAGVVWAWRIGWTPAVLGLTAWLVFWAVHGARLRDQAAVAAWLETGELVVLDVEVRERGDGRPFKPDALVKVLGRGPGGSAVGEADRVGVRLGVRGLKMEVRPGDRLRLQGRGVHFAAPRNPGERDPQRRIKRAGWAGELWVESAERIGARRWDPRRLAWRAHEEIRERIVWGLDESGTAAVVIRALVLGDRATDQVELFGAFRRSGTMHVFAVSGLHVGMVGFMAWAILWCLRVPRGWGLWLVLVVVWSYAMVTGLRPPAMRASIMASVFLGGFVLRRGAVPINALLASVPIVLGLDSFQWRQPGFQLSYLVVATIILLAPRFYRPMRRWVEGDDFLPRVLYTKPQEAWRRLREKTAALASVSAAAWLGSMPLMWMHFGIVTPVALLASMVLVPVVFLMLALAMGGLLVGLLTPAGEGGVNQVNGMIANGAHQVARGFASVPGAYVETHREAWWGRGMVVFDLRGGDGASYFGAGGGVLLDAGSHREFRRVVFPALRKGGAGVDSLVISHPDGGHCGGMAGAVEAWHPVQALLPVEAARSPYFKQFQRVAEQEGVAVMRGEPGRRYPLAGGAEFEVLWAPGMGEGSLADDRGMVVKLHWNGWRILMTGDAGFETENRLLDRGTDLKSDVWVMGRHAADQTGTLAFLRAVDPRAIVASEAVFPGAERIPDWWTRMVREEGVTLWNQGSTGAVALQAGEGTLELRSFLEKDRVLVLRR
jgi:competence protein ComEC